MKEVMSEKEFLFKFIDFAGKDLTLIDTFLTEFHKEYYEVEFIPIVNEELTPEQMAETYRKYAKLN